ncbi:MAG: SGNH/GDSL hydrolase family protein [Tepidiformaceae bacterium]
MGLCLLCVVLFVAAACSSGPGPGKPLEVGCAKGSIIAFGDSITQGVGVASPKDAFPAQLSRLIGRPVCNAGWFGNTAQDGLKRLDRDVLQLDPKTVLILFGTNDSGLLGPPLPLYDFRTDLTTMATTIDRHGAEVVFLSLPPINAPLLRSEHYTPELHPEYDEAIRAVAASLHAPLVDLTRAFGGDLSLLRDGAHPTDAGAAVIAKAVAAVLQALPANGAGTQPSG